MKVREIYQYLKNRNKRIKELKKLGYITFSKNIDGQLVDPKGIRDFYETPYGNVILYAIDAYKN